MTSNNFQTGGGFLETLEIELLQGNMFRSDQADRDNVPVLVNETFVKWMEWTQAIGKKVGQSEVIGVIRDFHYMPLHAPIAPVFIRPYSDRFLDELDWYTRALKEARERDGKNAARSLCEASQLKKDQKKVLKV